MSELKVLHVVGARPNFMKVAPIMEAFRERNAVRQWLVHTGQHFDEKMSDVFFRDLGMPEPDEHLHIGGGSHAEQTAKIMLAFEPVLQKYQPDWIVVVGDVNSTVACALVASKLGIRVAHVEAGLRSGDMTMPEEVNRRVVDVISDLLLIPSEDARENLLREGANDERIKFVGNVMIDTLVRMLPLSERSNVLEELGVAAQGYVLVTLHRPSNVDDLDNLSQLMEGLEEIAQEQPVLFPVHPRTRARLSEAGIELGQNIRLIAPLGYLDFMSVMKSAQIVVTDSGGIQEETTYLGIPCLTVRPNTERPVTISEGTNRLVAPNKAALVKAFADAQSLLGTGGTRRVPALWDGRAAKRIADAIIAAPKAVR